MWSGFLIFAETKFLNIMQQKAINIQGISSYLGPSSVADGQCLDIINARNVNGVVKPVNKEKVVANLLEEISGADPSKIIGVYYHAEAKRYIVLYEEDDVYSFIVYDDNVSFIETVRLDSISPAVSANFIGNIMIISHEEATYFFLFRNGSYEALGEKPPMPILNITINRKVYKHSHSVKYDTATSSESFWKYAIKGVVDACIYKGNKDSCYIDRTMVRFALRMYDGSYVMHSGIFLIEDDCYFYRRESIEDDVKEFNESNIFYNTNADKATAWVKMFKLDYSLGNMSEMDKWGDLIVGIDVFTTRSIRSEKEVQGTFPMKSNAIDGVEYIDIEDDNLISSKVSYYDRDDDLRAKILSESNFYKVASFDLLGNRIESNSITDTSDENLVLMTELTDDNNTHDVFASKCPYVYNSKLHLGSCNQVLFEGYDTTQFIEYGYYDDEAPESSTMIPDQSDRTEVQIYVYLKTMYGEKIVRYSSQEGYIPHARLLCYPDYRAYKMVVYYTDTKDGKIYRETYPLTKHEKLNLSYFMNPMNGSDQKNAVSIKSGINAELVGSFPNIPVSNVINRTNVLKVSKVDNPFFFPSDSTYSVGDEEIVGLASVSTALSTGQAGQFPLYVFSTDGIYSLEVDTTGELTYKNVSALERYVCNNPKSITPAIGGVFFTTDQGLMYLSGSTVKNISESIKYNRLTPASNLIKSIYEIEQLSEIGSDFQTFIGGEGQVRVCFLYKTNEIIITNSLYPDYSYKYCINTGFWYRVNQSYSNFVNVYPDNYGMREGVLYDIDLEDTEEENSILILSGPMSFESSNHKKIIQSVLRSDLYVNGKFGFYLMGSLDGEVYNLIGLKEIITEDTAKHCVDLVTKMKRSRSYKYFSFAITGGLKVKSSINYVGVTFDDSMTNRLR